MQPNNLILVGLGKIGFRGFTQTHYDAALKSNMVVVAGIDPNPDVRIKFTQETRIPSYSNLHDVPPEIRKSFYVVATPSTATFDVLKNLMLAEGPLGILVEKPFCQNSKESGEILDLYKKFETPLRINYSRQYSKAMLVLQLLAENNKLVNGLVIYSSGLRENGSHFLRLICGLFPMLEKTREVIWTNNNNFKIKISDNITINFVELINSSMHINEIILIFENISIFISEGYEISVKKINNHSNLRSWPRELETILEDDFSDCFASSYLDQSWWRSPNKNQLYKELQLDHLANLILESFPVMDT